jgi:transposase
MIDLLVDTHRKVEETREFALELPPEDLPRIEQSYSEIIQRGWEANPALPPSALTPKRGRKKQSKPQNLLQRLSKYREETLVFMHDFSVPFDNNQGERDGRMMKVQQKISGCFRSEDGAKYFCRIRGYLSTLGKQGLNVLDALKSVFVGRPMMPALDTS